MIFLFFLLLSLGQRLVDHRRPTDRGRGVVMPQASTKIGGGDSRGRPGNDSGGDFLFLKEMHFLKSVKARTFGILYVTI